MNFNKLAGLLVALLLPIAGFLVVNYFSKNAVHMPKRYFYDSVAVNNGKPDTLWHSIKSIEFTDQIGKKVSLNNLKGKIIVMDFIFTRCPSICPGLTKNMKRLQNSYLKNPEIVQFVSITVDPEHDTFPVLRKYAEKYNINYDNWWLLTGPKDSVYHFAMQEIKANIADTNVDTAFIHTENFFLIDSSHIVRGWYNGLDTTELKRLASDIPTLMLEKGKESKSVFRGFIPVLPLIFLGIAVVIIVSILLNKKRNAATGY